jgi:Rps23 Pro-64 3,4-dihydroxylase Tpa1-like proline 4-hydroxylase
MKNSFYSVFASYYFPGDYLLCHDDIIEDRKYAFSYYLEDFDFGGELVLFNNVPDKVEKAIKVRKNTLVIF